MRRTKGIRVGTFLSLIVVAASGRAFAQSNAEVNAGIQFDFSLPGARSLALGGAFVGLADDATAAWANPAGLTILSKKEVSLEARGWNFTNFITDKGMAFGNPSGVGVDTVAGLVDSSHKDTTGSLAYLSFVYPAKTWSVAAYRHQLSNFEAHLQSSGAFLRTTDTRVDPQGEIDRLDAFTAQMQLHIVDYGASFAYRVGERLSFGAGVGLHHFNIDAGTQRYVYLPVFPPPIDQRGQYTGTGQRFGPPDYSVSNLNIDEVETGSDNAAAFTVGALYREPNGKWSVGGAVRKGPRFQYQSVAHAGQGAPKIGVYNVGDLVDQEDVQFNVPDVYAAGASVRPTDTLMLTFEYDRVLYSQLSEHNAEVYGIEEAPFALNKEIGQLIREGLKFPDVNQIRMGAEYSIVQTDRTIMLRLGGWYDPDHRLAFDTSLPQDQLDLVKRLPVLFRPGPNQFHVAPGIGFAFRSFQIDGAADFSTRINSFSVSTVWHF
jgi:long-subunit fatty acid transport protein